MLIATDLREELLVRRSSAPWLRRCSTIPNGTVLADNEQAPPFDFRPGSRSAALHYSGVAHGFGWPRLISNEAVPGDSIADLWLTAATNQLAVDLLQKAHHSPEQ